jgi:hypothetical protein
VGGWFLAAVPYAIRRPCPVEWCFPGCQNCSIKRTPRRTLFRHCDSCSPQARPRGAQGCCGQASSVTSMSHYGLLHRTSGWQALMLSRWWAADARVERMGARPNRAVVVKTALTCDSYSHSSTVLEPRRERMKNSLVTMSARCWVVGGESGVLPRPLVYPRPAAG